MRYFRFFVCAVFTAAAGAFFGSNLVPASASAAAAAQQDMKEAVRQALKENPELVLDILKDHSETVLEIVQEGQMLRSRKIVHAQWNADAKVPKKPDLDGRAFLGPADAPVTIVAYSDYQCSYCRQAESTVQALLQKYKGKVRLYTKTTPNEDNEIAVAAARYATAAFMQDVQKGWAFHELLFADAGKVARDGEPVVKELAAKAGLDIKKLSADVGSPKVAAQIKADELEAERFGLRGTPYFLVGNYIVRGSIAPDLFEEVIERALQEKK